MVSSGGGAEGVSEAAAADAIRQGYAIVVRGEGVWRDFASIPFESEPPQYPSREGFATPRQRLAYAQAAMFVAWLRARDGRAFADLLLRIEDGESFKDAFRAGFTASPEESWRDFVSHLSK
jgi:hypothetical protein